VPLHHPNGIRQFSLVPYNPNKHHRRSLRLPGYNYTQPGAYYITICTYQRQGWFGDVVDGEMRCNRLGDIVYTFWQGLPHRFPHIKLDAFVVMPNHLHGILMITEQGRKSIPFDTPVESFGKPVPGSIPTVVRSFKSAVTTRINLMRPASSTPVWQRNYHESIIRIESGLDRVRQYIINNPCQWASDAENPRYNSDDRTWDLDLYF
jgi:REP element-mobilizing transposase RayT